MADTLATVPKPYDSVPTPSAVVPYDEQLAIVLASEERDRQQSNSNKKYKYDWYKVPKFPELKIMTGRKKGKAFGWGVLVFRQLCSRVFFRYWTCAVLCVCSYHSLFLNHVSRY